ncbi:MAG: PqqD family protein [Chloroflexi bacterium]|nr:PqqD family protein [Chloroflexota bacterium]
MRSNRSSGVGLLSRIARGKRQVSADLGKEVVLLGLDSEEYYGLEGVGARIWEAIAEPRTVEEILAIVLDEYDVDPGRCERDLLALVQELTATGLVQVTDGADA